MLPLVLFLVVGALLVGLSVPLIRRRVPPNAFYGLRVPATLADEGTWYEANERSGRDLAVLGAVQMALALALSLVPGVDEPTYAFANAAVLMVGTLGCAVVGWRRANRILARRRGERRG